MSPRLRLNPSAMLVALVFLLLSGATPALGQIGQNPPLQSCGLPSGKGGTPNNGSIYHDVTYSLSSDCVLEGSLEIFGAEARNSNTPANVIVNGNGYTITTSSSHRMFHVREDGGKGGTLTLNNLTIDGSGRNMAEMTRSAGTLTANNVTFRNGYFGTALRVHGNIADVTLNDVLFEANDNRYYEIGGYGQGAALFVAGSNDDAATVTLNRAVFRDNLRGSGAISIMNSSTVTANNCLGFAGNVPRSVRVHKDRGVWTDNTGGTACTGAIGNSGNAVVSEPALLACGLPGPGTLKTSATYTMKGDCDFNPNDVDQHLWRIGEGVDITINQNGTPRLFKGGSTNKKSTIWVAMTSTLTITGVNMENVFFQNWGTVNIESSTVSKTQFRTAQNWGTFNVKGSTLETLYHPGGPTSASVIYNIDWYQKPTTTIENAQFRDISGIQGQIPSSSAKQGGGSSVGTGQSGVRSGHYSMLAGRLAAPRANAANVVGAPALNNLGAGGSFIIKGCTTWVNVLPAKFGSTGVFTDNSGACSAMQLEQLGPKVNAPAVSGESRTCNPHCDAQLLPNYAANCLKLGAIGLICRRYDEWTPTAEIWGVREDSSGYFIQEVTQDQIDASPPGLVSASADGRVAVRVWEDRNITVQMGPTDEGKVHHVTLWHNLVGEVAGTIDTYGGPPGLDGVPTSGTTAAASAEAAGVHVVKTGDTLHDIAARYGLDMFRLIEFNQLADGGHMIYPGQQLRLPGSEGGGSAPVDTPAPLAKWVTAQEPGEDGTLVHVVQEGDTVWGIAVAYDVEPKTLMELNGFSGHGRGLWLAPGQRLLIRDGKTPPVASATST